MLDIIMIVDVTNIGRSIDILFIFTVGVFVY